MGNSVEYINYTCALFSYSQGRAKSEGIATPVLSKGRQQWELTFHHSIIGKFMVNMIWLKQLFTHPQHSEWCSEWCSLSVIIFEVNIVSSQKQTYWWRNLCFLQICISLNAISDPCPSAASSATCVLSNSTHKLSISTDMIIEILFAKLLAKFLTESHWRWIFSMNMWRI